MISRLLEPLLSLHGWQAYLLVGVLVFAEDSVMLGFVFPGETAAVLGGVLASKGGVSLGGILAVVVVCAIVGDSAGYAIGDRWGRQLLRLGPLRKRQKGIDTALDAAEPPRRSRRVRGPLLRLPARRCPGAGRHVEDALPHLPARQCAGRHLLGIPLRPPRLLRGGAGREGDRDRCPTSCSPSSPSSSWCSWCATAAGRSARSRGPRSPPHPGATRPADRGGQAGGSRTERSPARSPASTRANSPAASSPWASVSIQRTVVGSLRSRPKRPKRGS